MGRAPTGQKELPDLDGKKKESMKIWILAGRIKPFFDEPEVYVEGSKILVEEKDIEFIGCKNKKDGVIFSFISHPYWLRAHNSNLCEAYRTGKIPKHYLHIKVKPKLEIDKSKLEKILEKEE